MGSFGQVKLKRVFAMLDICAPGYTVKEQTHNYRVMWKGRTFPRLPKGAHGKKNPEIEVGHVKKMARHLGLSAECVMAQLREIGPISIG